MTPFRRSFALIVVGLVVLVSGFATLTFLQGPKLSNAQLDATAVVSKPAQTLRLFTNERVATVRPVQVRMTPPAPMTVSTSGQIVTVQFTRALDYGTRYRVTVTGVASADDGQTATLLYSFTTSSPALYYLQRSHSRAPDRIIETGIRSVGQKVVFSARRIAGFAVFDRAIAVSTLSASGESSLDVVATGSSSATAGAVQPITLPGPGTVDELEADRDSGELGFTFTSAGSVARQKYSNTLFFASPSGTAVATPVGGLGGTPLSVLDWSFVPASSEIVAQDIDQSVVLVDTSKANAVTPLGAWAELGPVATDGSGVVVSDDLGPFRLPLPAGKATRLTASTIDGRVPVPGDAALVPGGWIETDSLYDSKIGGFVQHLVFDDGHRTRPLFTPQNARGTIDRFSLSPNGQYVAVESTADESTAKPDGYAVDGRATTVSTSFIDVATGALVKSVVGFDVAW